MRRTTWSVGLLGLPALLAWAWAASPAEQPRPDDPMPKAQAERGDLLASQLAQEIRFAGVDDPKTSLGEMLDSLAQRYALTFDVNVKAFAADHLKDVLKTEIATPFGIPPMNASMETVLQRILVRLPARSGATFLIRRDQIEITTREALRLEIWGEDYTGPRLPLVRTSLNKRPLDEALNQLADQSQFTIVLDRRAGEKAATAVTARFRNVPLDTAVRLLAEMADLRSVHLDNVLFVTTKEHAADLEKRLEKENPSSKKRGVLGGLLSPKPVSWRKGPGQPQGVHVEGAMD
jgi:hypothetical protein